MAVFTQLKPNLLAFSIAQIVITSAQAETTDKPLETHQPTIKPAQISAPQISVLERMTVTGTRDERALRDTAASVGIVTEQTIESINPTHSADLLNRIPGVYIAQLGSTGQGVMAAIRQPISSGPVYLYLENGVPTRSPAFFNHNALYETNIAQANGVEVIKGPGSALYGSDAIGGVVNVISDSPIEQSRLGVTLEGGEHGWQRGQINSALATTSEAGTEHGFAFKLDAVKSDGWREHTDFDRQSMNLVWQTEAGGWDVNTVYSNSFIDMNTGGSGLSEDDYLSNPEQAGNLVGYRDVSAHRLSSAWTKDFGNSELSITPYARSNDLEYVATWTLNTGREVFIPWRGVSQLDSQDAHISKSGHDSLGAQIKFRQDLAIDGTFNDAFWITGVDIDYSQGYTEQTYIERTDNDAGDYWLEYQAAGSIYDFGVDFTSISPYIHGETGIGEQLRLSAGLRYDNIEYDYDNKLSTDVDSPIHKRPADTSVDMDHWSPKLGATYDLGDNHNLYAAYRHAFRIPSSGQLFRSGATEDSTNLEPVKADSLELGLRGQLLETVGYEMTIYQMDKEDDIVSVSDETGARRNVNAGSTQHKGVELGMAWQIIEPLTLSANYTYGEHTYKEWTDRSGDHSGNTMPRAPEDYAGLQLSFSPDWLGGGRFEAEWQHRGEEYFREDNEIPGGHHSATYEGHQLWNLRASYKPIQQLELYANLLNATDERYAESVSKWGPTFTPGRPRTLMAGARFNF